MFGSPSRSTRNRLDEKGVQAPATILEVADRGMTFTSGNPDLVSNTELVLKTKLRVEPAGQPAFEVRGKFRYPQMSRPYVGMETLVVFDPDDHDCIRLASSTERADDMVNGMFGDRTGGGISSLGDLMGTVKDAKRAHPGDRAARGAAMAEAFGMGPSSYPQPGAYPGGFPGMPGASPADAKLAQLERLAALHAGGALTDAEFAAQKAALL